MRTQEPIVGILCPPPVQHKKSEVRSIIDASARHFVSCRTIPEGASDERGPTGPFERTAPHVETPDPGPGPSQATGGLCWACCGAVGHCSDQQPAQGHYRGAIHATAGPGPPAAPCPSHGQETGDHPSAPGPAITPPNHRSALPDHHRCLWGLVGASCGTNRGETGPFQFRLSAGCVPDRKAVTLEMNNNLVLTHS